MMKSLNVLALLACLLPSTAFAEDPVWFGKWWVVRADNGDMVAGTHLDNFEKALVYRCFKAEQSCAHVLLPDIVCENGHVYPLLVNSDHSALSLSSLCSVNEGKHELLLTEFDAIHEIIRKANVIGFAIPMASGQFKAVRFDLSGSGNALDYAEKKIKESAEFF